MTAVINEEQSEPAPTARLPRVWLVLAALAGAGALWLALSPASAPRPLGGQNAAVGKQLPLLSLRPLTFAGDVISLEDVKGQVVVLNFWGTWCPPCRMELPHVAELDGRYKENSKVRVLAVSCGGSGSDPVSYLPDLQMETTELLKTMHIDLPAYADPDLRTRRAVKDTAGFQGYPTTLVLDPQGVIRGVWTGYADGYENQMAELIERLLAGAS
jgi:thiol-disulfide isomerase/thioredoxin